MRRSGSKTTRFLAGLIVAASIGAGGAPLLAGGALAETAAARTTVDPSSLAADQLVVETASGPHRFTVEIADDPIERARGLMFRETMDADAGMLFIFAGEGERAFWMQNTILPLDIIYADATGTVVSIARNTTPYSTDTIPSNGAAQYVLEVNAGVADEIGLAPGDRLVHRRIAP